MDNNTNNIFQLYQLHDKYLKQVEFHKNEKNYIEVVKLYDKLKYIEIVINRKFNK